MPTLKERLAAKSATKQKGIRITRSDPSEAPANRPERPEPRELGRTHGEDIPFDQQPTEEPAASWHEVRTALDTTDLGIWIDQEHAWIAVESRNGQPGLILICRLPLLNNRKENEPY
ncbi:MAG: hypothetical protein R3F07_03935 [Opitutaceae bacterium]